MVFVIDFSGFVVLFAIEVVKLGYLGGLLSREIFVTLRMAPKKRTKVEAGSPSQGFDGWTFANAAAHARYQRLSTIVVIADRGLECNDESYRHDPQFDEIRRNIITRGGNILSMLLKNPTFH